MVFNRFKKRHDVHDTAPAAVVEVDEHKGEKGEGYASSGDHTSLPIESTELHRGLKARHITMIAIGGAIGMFAQ